MWEKIFSNEDTVFRKDSVFHFTALYSCKIVKSLQNCSVRLRPEYNCFGARIANEILPY